MTKKRDGNAIDCPVTLAQPVVFNNSINNCLILIISENGCPIQLIFIEEAPCNAIRMDWNGVNKHISSAQRNFSSWKSEHYKVVFTLIARSVQFCLCSLKVSFQDTGIRPWSVTSRIVWELILAQHSYSCLVRQFWSLIQTQLSDIKQSFLMANNKNRRNT